MDMQEILEAQEAAERIYDEEKLFREYVDRRHVGHCDVPEVLNCIEEDHFLVRMLKTWDADPIDG